MGGGLALKRAAPMDADASAWPLRRDFYDNITAALRVHGSWWLDESTLGEMMKRLERESRKYLDHDPADERRGKGRNRHVQLGGGYFGRRP